MLGSMSRFSSRKPASPTKRPLAFSSIAQKPKPDMAPHAGVAQEADPALLAAARAAADEAGDDRVGPHRDIGVEIGKAMIAQDQPLGFDDGDVG